MLMDGNGIAVFRKGRYEFAVTTRDDFNFWFPVVLDHGYSIEFYWQP